MGNVVLHFSMSLDGFVAGLDVSVERPMGAGGERLHEWMFKAEPDRNQVDGDLARQAYDSIGAVVLGRRTFEVGLGHWGDTPYPAPSFVLTHEPRENLAMKSATFTFVPDGIESAVRQAKAAAGEKVVSVMGANTAQQVLKAGLADELQIQLIPVLLGAGARLFDHIGTQPIELIGTKVVPSPSVTHLSYRVVK